jgi:hypothetical protein
MGENQTLGGARQSLPLDDEMSYPLTHDEYLTLRENLTFSKFNNWESFLISTLITTLVTVVVFVCSSSFTFTIVENGKNIEKLEMPTIIILIIYSAISLSSLLCLLVSLYSKKKTKTSFERLDAKITKHLNN